MTHDTDRPEWHHVLIDEGNGIDITLGEVYDRLLDYSEGMSADDILFTFHDGGTDPTFTEATCRRWAKVELANLRERSWDRSNERHAESY